MVLSELIQNFYSMAKGKDLREKVLEERRVGFRKYQSVWELLLTHGSILENSSLSSLSFFLLLFTENDDDVPALHLSRKLWTIFFERK